MCPDKRKDDDSEEGGAQGGGGKTDKIGVRIATMAGDTRDEPRTPAERRHLAIVHQSTHADRIRRTLERQKALAAAREAGPRSLNQLLDQNRSYTAGGGSGAEVSPYKPHPISQTAYFSGTEESPIPSQNQQDLNENDRKELTDRLENKLQNRLSLQQAPKYSPPKPRPY